MPLGLDRAYAGLLFIGDPHTAARAPGFRCDDYQATVLAKLAHCLNLATARNLLPIVLGDLFHWARDNPNALIVQLIELLRDHQPFCVVGNHDTFQQSRVTDELSISILAAAGAIRLIEGRGPVTLAMIGGKRVLIAASPSGSALPRTDDVPDLEQDHTVWLTHHELAFSMPEHPRSQLREIEGIDLVVNGHLHAQYPCVRTGATTWCNPGSIVRIKRGEDSRVPGVAWWRPGMTEPEREPIPHKPYADVFNEPPEFEQTAALQADGEERFVRGLALLARARTAESAGLNEFLTTNLAPRGTDPVDDRVWRLFEQGRRA